MFSFSCVGNYLVHAVEPLFHASRRLNVRATSIERNDVLPIGGEPSEALAIVTAGWRNVIEAEYIFR